MLCIITVSDHNVSAVCFDNQKDQKVRERKSYIPLLPTTTDWHPLLLNCWLDITVSQFQPRHPWTLLYKKPARVRSVIHDSYAKTQVKKQPLGYPLPNHPSWYKKSERAKGVSLTQSERNKSLHRKTSRKVLVVPPSIFCTVYVCLFFVSFLWLAFVFPVLLSYRRNARLYAPWL